MYTIILVALAAGVYYLYQKYRQEFLLVVALVMQHWNDWRSKQQDAQHHKDPTVDMAREAAREAAVLRMMERYAAQSAEAAERRRQREEEKKQESIRAAEAIVRPGQKVDMPESGKKFSGRADYNPLMGGNSGGWRRAPRRSGGG